MYYMYIVLRLSFFLRFHKNTHVYLHPRMFYSNIFLENCFVLYNWETYMGWGLILDGLYCKNFVQWTKNDAHLSYTLLNNKNQ